MDPNVNYHRLLRRLIEDAEDAEVVLSEEEKGLLALPLQSARNVLPKIGKALTSLLAKGSFSDEAFLRFSRSTSPATIYYIRQLLLLESKYVPPTLTGVEQAVSAFKTSQKELRSFRVDSIPSPILRIAREFVTRVLRGLDLSTISPRQGPGAVSERWSRDEKWEGRSWASALDRYYPFEWYFGNTYIGVPRFVRPVARLIAVPKDFDKPRIISAEPWFNQYIQQGQMAALYRWFANSRLISCSTRLEDQRYNSQYLLDTDPSIFVTIDLSQASDTVPAALVWFLLSEVPNVRKYLFAARTAVTKWKGEEIPLSCFATMGSATCFPVETLVFLSLSYACVRFLNRDASMRSILKEIRVYGDDIIVPTYASDLLINVLSSVGMLPNDRKTCLGPSFRESCGVEAFDKVDCSIARNKHWDYEPSPYKDYGPVVALHNIFAKRGATRAAQFLRQLHPWIPIGSDSHSFVCEYLPSRIRGAMTRFNKSLQRLEHRVVVPASKPVTWRLPEARLLARLHRDYTEYSPYSGSSMMSLKMAWVAYFP